MKTYISIFRMKATEGLQYRTAAIAGASISIFWVWIEIIVYQVFYHYSDHASAGILAGLTLQQVITYAWLGQILIIMRVGGIDGEILSKITSGDVGIELCRPLNLYYHWFAKIAAGNVIPLIWRGSVILLLALLVPFEYRILPPISIAGLCCSLISVFSAFLLCSSFKTFMCAVRLNITWGEGPTNMILLIADVFSGAYLPLQLWPDFMQKFLLLQPFAGYLDIPLRFYLGTLSPDKALWVIGLQLLWATCFILGGKLIIDLRLKKIVVQGG